MADINKLYETWLDQADSSLQAELEGMSDNDKNECFSTSLTFGTAGLRGFLRAGTNGMNIHTVALATQGLANYVKSNFRNPSVAIARDSRNMGREFVEVCVGVLAANGVHAYFHPQPESTPGLSFTVRHLKCSAGICVTASHNPAEYNGYKVYGPDGCQMTTEASNAVANEISKLDIFDDVKMLDFESAMQTEFAHEIGPDVREAFIEAACKCSIESIENPDVAHAAASLKVAYTALHGTGFPEVVPALERNGFTNIVLVKEQIEPNGNFPTCPYPNPEMAPTMELGIKTAKDNDCDILIATDPDADRVGVAVKHNGEYVRLNGNEIGILLLNYICDVYKERGKDLEEYVCVTTIVSSDLVDALAEYYGIELRRTLTGFKYIGEQILHLEQNHTKWRYKFGFEESCGYLPGTHVRDKDGISACLLIAQMAAKYKAIGRDLIQILDSIALELGYYKNDQVSVEYPGVEGASRMQEVLDNLRQNPPTEFARLKVLSCKDYNNDTKMSVIGVRDDKPDELLPKSNVLEYQLEEKCKIIVRPSGTEPKIKVYCFAYDMTDQGAQLTLETMKNAARDLLS